MGEKISTQNMSSDKKGLSFTKIQQPNNTPFQQLELSCFTKLQRNELKQMMREVLSEYITPQYNRNDVRVVSGNETTPLERIRDDYHHGGYDEYDLSDCR